MSYIELSTNNIGTEHICCGFSDKKCVTGTQLKKSWLTNEFEHGFVFRRLDERAKVFVEYGPSESTWMPVTADNTLMLGCFWVSGSYKGKGYGKALLDSVIDAAKRQGKEGVVTVAGTKKFHFMSDTQWLLKQGFKVCDTTPDGFSLLELRFDGAAGTASFKDCAKSGECTEKNGLVVYYTNRCPFCEYYVNEVLVETAAKRNLPLKIIKLQSMEEAQSAPTPATIFSMFKDGKFVTTDLSVCLDNRFESCCLKSDHDFYN
ncbi:MAG: GNAT family N-acetyltransferase [Chloroflexi bacterium HGW-Chloroflexi-4]|nr:MAG: GNAT family N-acetyltransferase [Chloroflexi bacterium HGW-Chloroflexi-4]